MSYNLLKGKRGIIFGALNEQSIAWKVAEKAVEEGAVITLSNTPVAVRMGEVSALADKLHCEVIPADATSVEDLENVFKRSMEVLGGKIDFVLHSIGMSPNVRKNVLTMTSIMICWARLRYFCHIIPQNDSGSQETGCYCRIRFYLGFELRSCTAYILRIQ